jgi:hypothetical protein
MVAKTLLDTPSVLELRARLGWGFGTLTRANTRGGVSNYVNKPPSFV